METKAKYGLQGAFKVDIYDDKDNLVDTTKYFSNFITQSGLKYPTIYSFADCFRFLSVGQGTPIARQVMLLPVAPRQLVFRTILTPTEP